MAPPPQRARRTIALTLLLFVIVILPLIWWDRDEPRSRAGPGADRSYWTYELDRIDESAGATRAAENCAPFFDDDPTTDMQPEAPSLDRFDRAVLRACGALGGRVTQDEFAALIDDHFDGLQGLLPADWQGRTRDDVLADLRRIWMVHDGFDHIFCGEWRKGSIGGLHFRGRYLQLQAEGAACLKESGDRELLPGTIYTIGVESASGEEDHPKKGYALQQGARDLIRLGTKAVLACCRSDGGGWQPYRDRYSKRFAVRSDEAGQAILNQVICGAADPREETTIGLVTIYPDATPDPDLEVCEPGGN